MCLHHSTLPFLSLNWINLWKITKNKTTHNHTPTNWKQSKQANKSQNPGPGDLAWKGTWQRIYAPPQFVSFCVSARWSPGMHSDDICRIQKPQLCWHCFPEDKRYSAKRRKNSSPSRLSPACFPPLSDLVSVTSCAHAFPYARLAVQGRARLLLQQLSQSGERTIHWLTQGDLQVYTLFAKAVVMQPWRQFRRYKPWAERGREGF